MARDQQQQQDLSGVDPSEYKNIPGNQTPNTPDVKESEAGRRRDGGSVRTDRSDGSSRDRDLSGVDPSEYKNIPGNQTEDRSDVNES